MVDNTWNNLIPRVFIFKKMNKKAKKSSVGVIIIMLYLGMGIAYHVLQNPSGSWLNDLLLGGFNVIKQILSNLKIK